MLRNVNGWRRKRFLFEVYKTSHTLNFKNSYNLMKKVDSKSDYIYLNTIDGEFCAVNKHDGKMRWSIKDDSILKFPKNYEK